MKYAIILTLALTACGAEDQKAIMDAAVESQTKVEAEKIATVETKAEPSSEVEASKFTSIYLSSHSDLPFCDKDSDGVLAYVKDEQKFYNCSSLGWEAVELKGEKGDKGESVAGEKGEAGSDGAQGAPGTSFPKFNIVRNQDNAAIGTFIGYSDLGNTFNFVTPTGIRLTMNASTGAVATGNSLYFASANCSGTIRMTSLVGFQSVALDTRDGSTLYKSIGLNASSFTYASKTTSNGCENVSGTLTISFSTQLAGQPSFQIPLSGGISLQN